MPNKVEWITEWPTEEGFYWFYGWQCHFEIANMKRLKVRYVEVWQVPNGIAYVSDGEFLYKGLGGYGFWTEVEFPELPEIELPERRVNND